jgi:hypothetical protein
LLTKFKLYRTISNLWFVNSWGKYMFKKTLVLIVIPLALSSCSSKNPKNIVVEAMQKKDKNLSCKEILLEMNEADSYRNMAHKSRGPRLKNILMPLGYVSTYMNAEDAIEAAEARVTYLDKIYEIMHCSEKDEELQKLPVYKEAPAIEATPEPIPVKELPLYKPGPTSSNQLPVYHAEVSPDKYGDLPLDKDIPIGSGRKGPIEYEYSGVKLYQPTN